MSRAAPHVDIRHVSPNQSGREGARLLLAVVHATQSFNVPGLSDLAAIGSWFANPASEVSAHVCTDAEGNSARFVDDAAKAWHVAGYNRWALGIEQVGWTAQHAWPKAQLQETARWIARWHRLHGIPLQHAEVTTTGVIVRAGVIRHSELGAIGGGHQDPGKPDYPLHQVLDLARGYARRLK